MPASIPDTGTPCSQAADVLIHQRRESIGRNGFSKVVGRRMPAKRCCGMPIDIPRTCILRRVDPARNMARFYRLSIEPSLFGDVALVREWGRIGGWGRTRVDLFRVLDEAHAAFIAIEASKRRRGYLDQLAIPEPAEVKFETRSSCVRMDAPRSRYAKGVG